MNNEPFDFARNLKQLNADTLQQFSDAIITIDPHIRGYIVAKDNLQLLVDFMNERINKR